MDLGPVKEERGSVNLQCGGTHMSDTANITGCGKSQNMADEWAGMFTLEDSQVY